MIHIHTLQIDASVVHLLHNISRHLFSERTALFNALKQVTRPDIIHFIVTLLLLRLLLCLKLGSIRLSASMGRRPLMTKMLHNDVMRVRVTDIINQLNNIWML